MTRAEITREQIDRVKHFAADGRGLWVGAFVPTYPEDPAGRAKHPLRNWLPADAHVTVLHLGKRCSGAHVEQLFLSAQEAWREWGHADRDRDSILMEFTGAGWFWRRGAPTLVALINSADLTRLRADLVGRLERAGMRGSDQYGFVPHVTLTPHHEGSTVALEASLGRGARGRAQHPGDGPAQALKFSAPTLRIVCGDASVDL